MYLRPERFLGLFAAVVVCGSAADESETLDTFLMGFRFTIESSVSSGPIAEAVTEHFVKFGVPEAEARKYAYVVAEETADCLAERVSMVVDAAEASREAERIDVAESLLDDEARLEIEFKNCVSTAVAEVTEGTG